MKKVNLRDLYPDVYKSDHFVEVTEDVLETIRDSERAEAAYDRRMYRYKAHYSLDCDNGIENAILMKPQTPEMLLEEKQLREKLYAAVMALPEKQAKARAAKKDEIVEILKACTNIRDRLLMLLLAETGYRIGEILGIDYSKDIDYQNHIIRVYFREDNENGARAKNAEYRSAKISKDTFGFLNLYIAEYRKLLQHQTSLFVNISGDNIGKPMNVEAVYSMLKRMDKKTGIKITPHMLRHYFGNERRKAGWSLELIQLAYGHRHIQTTINYLDIVDDELLDASQEFYEKHSSLYGIEELL